MARLLLILLLCYYSQAFNLETRTPIVKYGGVYSDSYFGYSVAQHKTRDGEPVILVGAPKDQNLQPGTKKSGALYRCPLSLNTNDCEQVETDGRRHDSGRLYGIYDGNITQLKPPISSEIKEDQWLGVSLNSQGAGGRVIVCAHRYSVRNVDKFNNKPIDSKRAMLGMCYILNPDLRLPRDTNIGAKNVLVVREALRGKKLQHINDFDNHAKFGVCQVGTSSGWVKSGPSVSESGSESKSEDYALFGAPGCFTWRGNVLGQRTGTTGSYETALQERNYLGFTKHGHLGLSVTSGRYFDNELHYVSGAPHVNKGGSGSGEIYFFKQNPASASLDLEAAKTLRGGGFGSGFGYTLHTLDVNGDGLDDLLVGAPFTEHTNGGGSVFLYLNVEGSLDNELYLELRGGTRDSQFGLAITGLGDINKDGFDDFAVGSPYEDMGVVYVYLGASTGISGHKLSSGSVPAAQLAAQLIRGRDLAASADMSPQKGLSTFGYSLSGGTDLDGNNYPDLLVGSYQSNAVHLLLARPIINISTSLEDSLLQAVDPGQAGCARDPDSEYTCFHFSACFKVEARFTGTIRFRIEAEPNKPVSRVGLRLDNANGSDNRTKVVEHNLFIQEGGRDYCTTLLGYLSNSQTDLQTAVKFSLSYSLVQEEPHVTYNRDQSLPDIDQYPILNQQQAIRTFSAKFQKNCGDDDVCQAQLIVKPRLLDKTGEFARSKDGMYELELGTLPDNQFILDINVQNLGEAAYESSLNVSFPGSISYVGLGNITDLNDVTIINSTLLSFDLGNPFKGKSERGVNSVNLQIRFAPNSVINETLISFEMMVRTTSELVVDSSTFLHCVVVRRAELKISGRGLPLTVFYGGTVRGESALRNVSEIGPLVQHRYLVTNYGPSEVDVVTIKIKWPYQVENMKPQGKWLLYLTDHPLLKNGKGDCTVPTGMRPNPLNLTSKSEHFKHRQTGPPSNMLLPSFDQLIAERFQAKPYAGNGRRRRREVEHVVAPVQVKGSDPTLSENNEMVIRLDCDRGTAKCLTITCQVYNLPARDSVTVDIRSRLWNATLVEDYSDMDRVEIYSKASVIIDSVYTQDLSNDYESVLTVALADRQLEPIQSLDWWVYIVSAVVGLLVLVLIVLILWKLGFFRRTRPVDDDTDFMVSANYEKVKLNAD